MRPASIRARIGIPCGGVIPLAMQHHTLLERNLIYTAVTRGKKLMTINAQPKALAMAVKNRKTNGRLQSWR